MPDYADPTHDRHVLDAEDSRDLTGRLGVLVVPFLNLAIVEQLYQLVAVPERRHLWPRLP